MFLAVKCVTTEVWLIFSQKSKPTSGTVSEEKDDIEENYEQNNYHNPGGRGLPLTPCLLGMSWRQRLGGRVT